MAHNLFGPKGLNKNTTKKDDAPDLDELQSMMGGNQQSNREESTATGTEDIVEAPAQPPVAKPADPVERPKSTAGKGKKKKEDDAEDEKDLVNKDKFSIYLPKDLSRSMRIAYAITGKKFSHQAEDALTEMFNQRYQCHKAKCGVRFSVSDASKVPTNCPCCGGKDISVVRYEF
jgi:hypothetical protein